MGSPGGSGYVVIPRWIPHPIIVGSGDCICALLHSGDIP